MNNPRVGDRVDLNKLVVGESYMHLTNQEFYIPVKMKSIDKDPKSGILWIEFKILGDIGGRFIPTIIGRRPSEESPFFEDLKEMGRNAITQMFEKRDSRDTFNKVYELKTGQSASPGTGPADLIRGYAGLQPPKGIVPPKGGKTRRRTRSKRTRSKKYKR
jgi:hypothetical protein